MLIGGVIDLARRRHGVALGLYVLALLAALACEWLMLSGRPLPAPITLSAGVLSGSLVSSRRSRWGTLIAITIVLRLAFCLVADGPVSPAWLALDVLGLVAVALLMGVSPALLISWPDPELTANEIVVAVFAGGTLGIGALVFLHYLLAPGQAGWPSAATTTLSLAIGYLLSGAPIVVLARRTHATRPATLARRVVVLVSIVAFVVATFAAMAGVPAGLAQGLGPLSDGWTWIMAIAGILMSLRVHTIGVFITIFVGVAGAGMAFFRRFEGTAAGLLDATLDWQLTTVGLLVVLISFNALVVGVRRANDQRRAQVAIIEAMLGRPESGPDAAPDAGDGAGAAYERALAAVAGAAEADTARLYRIDAPTRTLALAHAWPAPEVSGGEVSLREVSALFEPVMLGRNCQLTVGRGTEDGTVAGLARLGLADMHTAYLQPIVQGNQVIGAATVMCRAQNPFRTRDLEPLLSLISEFYVIDLTRERAFASIGNYQRRLRELAARTAQAEERVRRETAVELHDSLIQRLAVARMKLGELRHRGGDTGPVAAITDIVDESLAASRAIIHELSPSVVYELGLVAGLEKLVDDLRTEGRYRLTLRQHGDGAPLDEPVRVGIYHVVQELVANSIAHSGGDQVWIDVYWEQAALDAVVVSDNGRGDAWWLAETEAAEPSGLGLLSASERLRPIGYDIKFERRLGGGTRAIVFWSSPADG